MKISYLSSNRTKILVIILLNLMDTSRADRVNDKIYTTLQSDHYCGRRMNATNQVGCQSELNGNFGIVWIVQDASDLLHVLKTGPTPPYIPILRKSHFTKENILNFKASPDRVSGVVFLDSDHDDSKSRLSPFSPDDVCPNRYSGLYTNDSEYGHCKHPWQEESPVSGLLYENIPFPIFLINEKKSIDDIQDCFSNNNVVLMGDEKKRKQAAYPLCGIELDSFMLAAKDSSYCLNSRFFIDEILQSNQRRCYTVDNNNIFAYYKLAKGPLHPVNDTKRSRPDTTQPQSIVMLVAKLSSLSMFSEISPGADSTITSIVTILAVAEALARVSNSTSVEKSKRNILFALFDSEPFDYTGSTKVVHEMMANTFPYSIFRTNETESLQNTNLTSIDYIINLDQLANYPSSETIYFHSDPLEPSTSKLDKIYDVMRRVASKEKVSLERVSGLPLPPTSVHQFIKHGRELSGNQLTGLVLSNYGKTYRNKLYNSIYDDSHNINQTSKLVEHLTQVSQFLARSLYEITFQVTSSTEISVSKRLIEELLYCYLVDAQCHLFTRACQAGQKLPSGPIQTYKDPTKRSDDINGIITSHLLAYFLGDRVSDYNRNKCYEENMKSLIYDYQYINDRDEPVEDGSSGTCIRSQLIVRSSDSPAYIVTEDGEIIVDEKYPAWTVSLNGIRNPVRLYLVPSPLSQWSLFVFGIIVTITSFVIVLALKTKLKSNLRDNHEQAATST